MTLPTNPNNWADTSSRTPDPFPRVPPALLNSSDISSYARATGMVFPFEDRFLKSSSYAIRIGTKVIYWDGKGRKIEKTLEVWQSFVVPRNSIVFISTFEKFKLPAYIAMRFNLKINNVHRGILLGTGPLVDPGFEGHLLIPLHNLTTNDYTFRAGETFVWVEFTKTSPHARWDVSVVDRYREYKLDDKYVPFPESKKNLREWDYLDDAFKGSIRSSIPDALESAKTSAARAETLSKLISVGVVIGVLTFAVGLYYWATPIMLTFRSEIDAGARDLEVLHSQSAGEQGRQNDRIERLSQGLDLLRNDARTLSTNEARWKEFEDRLDRLEQELQLLTNQKSPNVIAPRP